MLLFGAYKIVFFKPFIFADSKSFGKIVALSKAGSLESTGVKTGLSLSFSKLENNLKGRVDGKSRAK